MELAGLQVISIFVILYSLPSLSPPSLSVISPPSLSPPSPYFPTSAFPPIFLVGVLPLTKLLPYYPLLDLLDPFPPYFLVSALPLADFLHPRYLRPRLPLIPHLLLR